KNPIPARIQIKAFEVVSRVVPIAAVNLDGFVDDEVQRLAPEDLEDRTLDGVFLDRLQHVGSVVHIDAFKPAIHEAGGSINHAVGHPGPYRHFSELVTDSSETGDWLSER